MIQLPPSVIGFGICAFLFMAFGLHLGHMRATGTEEYIKQQMKLHNLTIKQAEERTRLQLVTDIAVTVVSGALAFYFAMQTILNLINQQQ